MKGQRKLWILASAALALAVISAGLDLVLFYYHLGVRIGDTVLSYAVFPEVVAAGLATWMVRAGFRGRWYVVVPVLFAVVVVAETLVETLVETGWA